MTNLESWILSYLLNSLWQIPLLLVAGLAAARALRPAGAEAEHRVWVIVLVLQSLLPALSTLPWQWLRALFAWGNYAHRAGGAHVSVVMGPGTAAGAVHLRGGLLTAVAIVYGSAIAYFAARFFWRWMKLSVLRRDAAAVVLSSETAIDWARCLRLFEIDKAQVATSSRIFGPVTLGVFRKLVLLPASMIAHLPEADLHTVISHECAHMHRNDFLKNLIYELLSLPASYHPLFRLTRERIMESREMVCDQMAAEFGGRNEYARSLLRLASLLVKGMSIRTPHAIGIFDANVLERRLMKLTEKRSEIRGVRRVIIVAACAAFGVATCGSALALSMRVDATKAANDNTAPKNVRSIAVAPEIMAGQRLSGPNPKYPVEAKKAKIQGTVVLNAVIGKDGAVKEVTAASGPKELRASSIEAVRQWIYKPYLLNGDPVEVDTTINVIYSLAK